MVETKYHTNNKNKIWATTKKNNTKRLIKSSDFVSLKLG